MISPAELRSISATARAAVVLWQEVQPHLVAAAADLEHARAVAAPAIQSLLRDFDEVSQRLAHGRALAERCVTAFDGSASRKRADSVATRAVPREKDEHQLYDELADRIREGTYRSIGKLALEYRSDLVRLGKMQPDSTDGSALRRLQELLAKQVYGTRIPEDELPERIRTGRSTGDRKRGGRR